MNSPFLALQVRGASMRPALAHGDRVLVRRGRCPRRGDVVVFEASGGALILHRVVVRCGRTVRTMGDASTAPDAARDVGEYLGVAEWVIDGTAWRPVPPAPLATQLRALALVAGYAVALRLPRPVRRLGRRVIEWAL